MAASVGLLSSALWVTWTLGMGALLGDHRVRREGGPGIYSFISLPSKSLWVCCVPLMKATKPNKWLLSLPFRDLIPASIPCPIRMILCCPLLVPINLPTSLQTDPLLTSSVAPVGVAYVFPMGSLKDVFLTPPNHSLIRSIFEYGSHHWNK